MPMLSKDSHPPDVADHLVRLSHAPGYMTQGTMSVDSPVDGSASFTQSSERRRRQGTVVRSKITFALIRRPYHLSMYAPQQSAVVISTTYSAQIHHQLPHKGHDLAADLVNSHQWKIVLDVCTIGRPSHGRMTRCPFTSRYTELSQRHIGVCPCESATLCNAAGQQHGPPLPWWHQKKFAFTSTISQFSWRRLTGRDRRWLVQY